MTDPHPDVQPAQQADAHADLEATLAYDPTGQPERTIVDVEVAAPVEDVWRALRDPDLVRQWFGWDYEGLDDEIRLIFGELAREDVPTGEHRELSWGDGDGFVLDALDTPGPAGTARTRVRVVRHGHPPMGNWDGVYDDVDEGWIAFAQQLRYYLDRHPGQSRRTVWHSGAAPAGRATAPLPGGTPWYGAEHQRGTVVADPAGDLLVVAMAAPRTHARPDAVASLVVSAYAVADAAYDDLSRRWTTWWETGADPTGR